MNAALGIALALITALAALLWLVTSCAFVLLRLLACLLDDEPLRWRDLAAWLFAWPWRI